MNCSVIVRDEFAERYVLGRLSLAEQEAYERHYFECDRCFGELQTLQAIRAVLRAAPPTLPAPNQDRVWTPWWRWLAAGAVAASLVGVVLLLRPPGAPEPVAQNPARASSIRPPAAVGGTDVATDTATSRPEPVNSPATASRRLAVLAQLARVEPPRYSPRVLRGVTDEATLRFREGMEAYSGGDYPIAVQKLSAAATADPSRPDIAFFLGASELLSGDTAGAVRELQRTIRIGETPFLEEAHFYLAKAYLEQSALDLARTELVKVRALHGEKGGEADAILAQLASLPSD